MAVMFHDPTHAPRCVGSSLRRSPSIAACARSLRASRSLTNRLRGGKDERRETLGNWRTCSLHQDRRQTEASGAALQGSG